MKAKVVEKIKSTVEEHKTELILVGAGAIFITGCRIGYKVGGKCGMLGLYEALEKVDAEMFNQLLVKGIQQGATIRW